MDIKAVKKTINRAKHAAEECLFTTERTELTPEFQKELKDLEDAKRLFPAVVTALEAQLQPDPAVRLLPGLMVQGANNPSKTEAFGISLEHLTVCLYGTELGSASEKVAVAVAQLGQAEREWVSQAQSVFLHVVKDFVNGPLKELETQKKLLETRRLDLDRHKLRCKSPAPPGGEAAPETGEEKEDDKMKAYTEAYKEQLGLVREAVTKAHETYPLLQKALNSLVETQRTYCKRQLEVLAELDGKI